MNDKKRIVISCGPIPARLDAVKFITNRFKGGLAFKTARYLQQTDRYDITVVKWKFTDCDIDDVEIVDVEDVFGYYDWFEKHAHEYDGFIMAAAVANLAPAHPFEGKFPSHAYSVGDEFDIKFTITPRAIDIIKQKNPYCTLIGYKLFDEPDDAELVRMARKTLDESRANIIFANRPDEAKTRKLACTSDGSVIECDFGEHLMLIDEALESEYYRTIIEPLDENELEDTDILEAILAVRLYENTFPMTDDGKRYGTVAVPVENTKTAFATTARGHEGYPVIVHRVDHENRIVYATGKATLNAPALAAMLDGHKDHIVVHRHTTDSLYKELVGRFGIYTTLNDYIFPGTSQEVRVVEKNGNVDTIAFAHHGYLQRLPIKKFVDWTKYLTTFPQKYMGVCDDFERVLRDFAGKETLEVGGNRYTTGKYAYDPHVKAENAENLTWDEVMGRHFDLIYVKNALNYLTYGEIGRLLTRCDCFIANSFREPPSPYKLTENEAAVRTSDTMISHTLRTDDDTIIRHAFYYLDPNSLESIGLTVTPYGKNSMLVTKGLTL